MPCAPCSVRNASANTLRMSSSAVLKVEFGHGAVPFLERFMRNLPRDFWAWSQLLCWGSEAAPGGHWRLISP